MNPENNKPAFPLERYLRPATFFLLSVAIGLSLWMGTGSSKKESDAVILERMTHTRSDLMFRLLSLQTVSIENLESKEERDFVKNAILDQLKRLDDDPSFRTARTEVQRRMILEYLGEDISSLNDEALGAFRQSFQLLYTAGKLPPEKDPILLVPASRLALLRVYRTADPAKYESLLTDMKHEASRMQFLLTLGLLVFGVSILIGIFLIARFFLRRPPPFFARFLETIPVEKRGVLLESAILYLFLVFPAGMVIQRFIPARMQVEFQVIYTVLSAVVALWYFRSEAGLRMLVQTLWIPVVVSPSAEEPGKPAGSEPVPSDAKGPTALMVVRAWAPIGREILYGVGAALIFLPPLMMRSAAGAIMGEGQFEFRFVNPTVLPGDGRFWLLMIFAVGIIPVIEEMVMHNWLYGALRFRFSVLFSAILTGVFCAALQPPGWWPFLMIPGAGLALLREFRPGLVAPVVAHSLLNAFTVLAGLGLSLM